MKSSNFIVVSVMEVTFRKGKEVFCSIPGRSIPGIMAPIVR